jgi:hypothetical protein
LQIIKLQDETIARQQATITALETDFAMAIKHFGAQVALHCKDTGREVPDNFRFVSH